MATNIEFEKYNPFRRPDWRHERVMRMLARMPNPGRTSKRDDQFIKAYRNFVLRYRSYDETRRNLLMYECPGLAFAYRVFAERPSQPRKSIMMECRILAGQSDQVIAKEMNTVTDMPRYYEALFFNVRDRLNAYDWVIDHVLLPSYDAGMHANEPDEVEAAVPDGMANAIPVLPRVERTPCSEPFFDATLKFFAYFGGPIVLDYVLTGFQRGMRAISGEGLADWFDSHTSARIRHRSAMAAHNFEVNKYNAIDLFTAHMRIVEIEKSIDSDENKKAGIHANVAAMMRSMPWGVGNDGKKLVKSTSIELYDGGAAELRDSELQLLGAGQTVETVNGLELMLLPRTEESGKEVKQHGDA